MVSWRRDKKEKGYARRVWTCILLYQNFTFFIFKDNKTKSCKDLDLEHQDIMVKALNAYKLHRNKDCVKSRNAYLADDTTLHVDGIMFSPSDRNSVVSSNESGIVNLDSAQETKDGRVYVYDSLVEQLWSHNFNQKDEVSHKGDEKTQLFKRRDVDIDRITESTDTLSDNHNNFKLAHCRLIYNDVKKRRKIRPKSAAFAERTSASRSLDSSGGVLVDSVGHVYGQRKPRPWSALPQKFSSFLKTACTGSEQIKDSKRNSVDEGHRKLSVQSGQVKIVTLQPPYDTMAQPIPRSVAFNRRNRTTFSWSENPTMSQSLPNTSFLHKQFTCSSPRMVKTASPSPTIRAGKPSFSNRPNSSYSYDGGFFLGAHTGQAEYFVIHPDWVSEAMTIRKLNGNKTDEEKMKNFSRKPPQRRWSDRHVDRRCLSAPPPKFRNPITWDKTDDTGIIIDIPNVQ